MKQCPVCKETFADEFSFCDLDGTPLGGDSNVSATTVAGGGASRLWPIVGVALVLGTLVTAVASIIFFPRTLSAPPPLNQTQSAAPARTVQSSAPAVADTSKTAETVSPSDSQDALKPPKSADVIDPAYDQTRLGAKKGAGLRGQNPSELPIKNASGLSLNPKSAVQPRATADVESPEDSGNGHARAGTISAAHESSSDRAASNPGSKTGSGDSSMTAGQPKHRTSKSDGANATDKAASKNAKKKKGGFLKIFKKIFGQG